MKIHIKHLLTVIACMLISSLAHAQNFPNKGIKFIVPFPAGSVEYA